ncbi:MAG: hypothetical protein SF162_11750 [bacterium]|nr:hypothetical protein [bacterium]
MRAPQVHSKPQQSQASFARRTGDEINQPAADYSAFSPTHILQLQRLIGNQATLKLMKKTAAPITSVRQAKPVTVKSADGRMIRRAVGFEFQTGWGVIRNPGRFLPYIKYKKGKVLRDYGTHQMTADESANAVGAELEWVVHPPIEESQPVATVTNIMTALENVANLMTPHADQQRVDLGAVTGDASLKGVEARPTLAGEGAATMDANPQVTGGIRLGRLMQLMSDVKDVSTGTDTSRTRGLQVLGMKDVLKVLVNEESGLLAAGYGRTKDLVHPALAPIIGGQPLSSGLKGLVASLIAAMYSAHKGYVGGPFPYLKSFALLLARTDYSSMFKMMPPNEQNYYKANPDEFVTLVCTAAGFGGTMDNPMFTKGVMKVDNRPEKGTWTPDITRRAWLHGITQGVDLLSRKQFKKNTKLESLGALGSKTDTVRHDDDRGTLQAPIFEFRKVQQHIPMLQWKPFAEQVFEYIKYLNTGNTEEEDRTDVGGIDQIDDGLFD